MHDFGEQSVDAGPSAGNKFYIVNQGTSGSQLNITSVSIVGADASQFVISEDTGESMLRQSVSRNVTIKFDPTTTGNKTAKLRILSNDTDEGTLDISLLGTGTD